VPADPVQRDVIARFVDQLTATLVAGSAAETPLGLFFVWIFPGYDGRNPRTGELVAVGPRPVPLLLPSDAFCRQVLGPKGLDAAGHRRRQAEELASPDSFPLDDLGVITADVADPEPRLVELALRRFPERGSPVGDEQVLAAAITGIGEKKRRQLKWSGLGTFSVEGRLPRLCFTPSQVLKEALKTALAGTLAARG
jgi:nucleoid DNA-binding protein